ncbi:four-carbon acid sugar kinase family protein [Vagococcus carniphilus]|uniref:four-carbon acid sugar kinase family protein n=1 Tax=Vagococcus carniphilus TaxID=218144 RepID=UPI00288F03AF|nr:four-carbon acid sugar kinase family protein [Vagococcus carniphilus]MDT2831961.1 four-carbon acid sugar kinase family protein [Vagococcus carniphilus]MDT2840807.1 four-carbon acid sugar kinase family protein [Vagococcus carniphilus]MDT2850376.1 four-carbon acid sugar kinase family protein [Vagococcus carniphilus]MDT2855471.1 four-carbon acid sugar kinase family protein [Vagococcus carniphilus]
MNKVGIIADDLTGATTVGVLLARNNIRTAAFFSDFSNTDVAEMEAIVLSSDSRHLSPENAKKSIHYNLEKLVSNGCNMFSKRIDTTLRGGIGHEVDEFLDNLPDDTIGVMVPSMPQSNRILVGGYSIIDGIALSKTDVANDVRTPIKETYVPEIIGKQTRHKIGMVGLSSILGGKESTKAALAYQKSLGARIIICDAVSIEEIEMIAESVSELNWRVLAIDPGPFSTALALNNGLGRKNMTDSNLPSGDQIKEDGKVIAVAGSATAVTRDQIKYIQAFKNVESLSIDPIVSALDSSDIQRQALEVKVAEEAKKSVSNLETNVTVLETAVSSGATNLDELDAKNGFEKGMSAANINNMLGTTVLSLLENDEDISIDGLYLTGGDTMVTVLKSIGAVGIELIDYVIPQTDFGKVIGGTYAGLKIIGKGGLTGKLDTAAVAINKMIEEN